MQLTQLQLEKLRWEAAPVSSSGRRGVETSAGCRSSKLSRGGGDGSPDSSYMEEIDIDNTGNVILQSATQSRLQITSARTPTTHAVNHLSKGTSAPLATKKNAHTDKEVAVTGTAPSTLGQINGMNERDSHSSLVEFGTVREINAAYEDDLDQEWHEYTVESDVFASSHQRDDVRDGGGSGSSARSSTRSSREVVFPVNEFADSEIRASWESDNTAKRRYDPSKYNAHTLDRSRDSRRTDRVANSSSRIQAEAASTLDDTISTDIAPGTRRSHSDNTAIRTIHHTASPPRQSHERKPERMTESVPVEVANRKSRDRIVNIAPDGTKVTTYGNGTIKTTYVDGSTEVRFVNGDTKKQIPSEGKLIYYYAHAKTTHTTYADETELYEFPNGQVIKLFCLMDLILFNYMVCGMCTG